jgi:hypothetical protein
MHSLFFAVCEGAGLALAAGVLAGSPGRSDALGGALAGAAAIVGALLFAWALSHSDHVSWPGYIAGALLALGAFAVARDVAAGAAGRAGEGPGAVMGIVALTALVLAGLSLLVPPIAIVAFVAIAYLALARRRKAGRKYEGLRVLR